MCTDRGTAAARDGGVGSVLDGRWPQHRVDAVISDGLSDRWHRVAKALDAGFPVNAIGGGGGSFSLLHYAPLFDNSPAASRVPVGTPGSFPPGAAKTPHGVTTWRRSVGCGQAPPAGGLPAPWQLHRRRRSKCRCVASAGGRLLACLANLVSSAALCGRRIVMSVVFLLPAAVCCLSAVCLLSVCFPACIWGYVYHRVLPSASCPPAACRLPPCRLPPCRLLTSLLVSGVLLTFG
jgi:hypothetical protein